MRRPVELLLRWLNSLLKPIRTEKDFHRVFTHPDALSLLLTRLTTKPVPASRSRNATRLLALANIEQALALVWRESPCASAMPLAENLLDASPKHAVLRFVNELYAVFVIRPAMHHLERALRWAQKTLRLYGLQLPASVTGFPFDGLVDEMRSGAMFACLLHAWLPPHRTAELAGTSYQPRSESERATSVEAVFCVLQREKLAPCSAQEFLNVTNAHAREDARQRQRQGAQEHAHPHPHAHSHGQRHAPARPTPLSHRHAIGRDGADESPTAPQSTRATRHAAAAAATKAQLSAGVNASLALEFCAMIITAMHARFSHAPPPSPSTPSASESAVEPEPVSAIEPGSAAAIEPAAASAVEPASASSSRSMPPTPAANLRSAQHTDVVCSSNMQNTRVKTSKMAELGAISPLGGRALENVFVTADAEDLARRCMHAGEMDAALASSVPQRAFIRRACEDARVRFHLHTQADPQSTHKRSWLEAAAPRLARWPPEEPVQSLASAAQHNHHQHHHGDRRQHDEHHQHDQHQHHHQLHEQDHHRQSHRHHHHHHHRRVQQQESAERRQASAAKLPVQSVDLHPEVVKTAFEMEEVASQVPMLGGRVVVPNEACARQKAPIRASRALTQPRETAAGSSKHVESAIEDTPSRDWVPDGRSHRDDSEFAHLLEEVDGFLGECAEPGSASALRQLQQAKQLQGPRQRDSLNMLQRGPEPQQHRREQQSRDGHCSNQPHHHQQHHHQQHHQQQHQQQYHQQHHQQQQQQQRHHHHHQQQCQHQQHQQQQSRHQQHSQHHQQHQRHKSAPSPHRPPVHPSISVLLPPCASTVADAAAAAPTKSALAPPVRPQPFTRNGPCTSTARLSAAAASNGDIGRREHQSQDPELAFVAATVGAGRAGARCGTEVHSRREACEGGSTAAAGRSGANGAFRPVGGGRSSDAGGSLSAVDSSAGAFEFVTRSGGPYREFHGFGDGFDDSAFRASFPAHPGAGTCGQPVLSRDGSAATVVMDGEGGEGGAAAEGVCGTGGCAAGCAAGCAKVSAGECAKVSAGECAKVSAAGCAKVSAGECAKVSAGECAKVSAGECAKVSAAGCAKVSAGECAKVSAAGCAKVSAGEFAGECAVGFAGERVAWRIDRARASADRGCARLGQCGGGGMGGGGMVGGGMGGDGSDGAASSTALGRAGACGMNGAAVDTAASAGAGAGLHACCTDAILDAYRTHPREDSCYSIQVSSAASHLEEMRQNTSSSHQVVRDGGASCASPSEFHGLPRAQDGACAWPSAAWDEQVRREHANLSHPFVDGPTSFMTTNPFPDSAEGASRCAGPLYRCGCGACETFEGIPGAHSGGAALSRGLSAETVVLSENSAGNDDLATEMDGRGCFYHSHPTASALTASRESGPQHSEGRAFCNGHTAQHGAFRQAEHGAFRQAEHGAIRQAERGAFRHDECSAFRHDEQGVGMPLCAAARQEAAAGEVTSNRMAEMEAETETEMNTETEVDDEVLLMARSERPAPGGHGPHQPRQLPHCICPNSTFSYPMPTHPAAESAVLTSSRSSDATIAANANAPAPATAAAASPAADSTGAANGACSLSTSALASFFSSSRRVHVRIGQEAVIEASAELVCIPTEHAHVQAHALAHPHARSSSQARKLTTSCQPTHSMAHAPNSLRGHHQFVYNAPSGQNGNPHRASVELALRFTRDGQLVQMAPLRCLLAVAFTGALLSLVVDVASRGTVHVENELDPATSKHQHQLSALSTSAAAPPPLTYLSSSSPSSPSSPPPSSSSSSALTSCAATTASKPSGVRAQYVRRDGFSSHQLVSVRFQTAWQCEHFCRNLQAVMAHPDVAALVAALCTAQACGVPA